MGKFSRAPRAVKASGRRERMLDRVAWWVRPVALLATAAAVLVWAEALLLRGVPSDPYAVLGLLGFAVVTVVAFRYVPAMTRPEQRWQGVAACAVLLLGPAALGAAGLWLLAGGRVDLAAIFIDLELVTSPSSEPPQPAAAVHIGWCILVLVVVPFLLLLLRALRPHAARLDAIDATRAATAAEEAEMLRRANRRASASARGRMTGFEPSALAKVELRPSERMHGEPGLGLTAMRGDASSIAKGLEGERNLAKALQQRGLLDRFATFWSVQMPSDALGPHEGNRGDLDCVVVTGRRIYVLDAKAYRQGDVTRYTEGNLLYVRDNPTGHDIGAPRRLDSAHLRLATDALRRQLHAIGAKQQVAAAVVLMPDDDGLGYADGAFWPGGIPAWDLLQLLEQLEQEPPFDERSRHSEHVLRTLRALVKDASGAAPTLRSVTRANAAQRTAQLRQARQAGERPDAGRRAEPGRTAAPSRPAEPRSPFGPDDALADRLPF